MIEKQFCVGCFIYDKTEKSFLLVHHRKIGKWIQPGGHIETNEDPEEAIHREVFEETGLKIKLAGKRLPAKKDYILPLAIQKDQIGENHIHIVFMYAGVPFPGKQTVKPAGAEVFDAKWFPVEDITGNKIDTLEDVAEWCRYIHENFEKLHFGEL